MKNYCPGTAGFEPRSFACKPSAVFNQPKSNRSKVFNRSDRCVSTFCGFPIDVDRPSIDSIDATRRRLKLSTLGQRTSRVDKFGQTTSYTGFFWGVKFIFENELSSL
uniref:Uncharacterized protein n=1 Tax=Cacopsylla melanoneura TaxID=428564 RepID=A0A8D8LBT6_9HEMI